MVTEGLGGAALPLGGGDLVTEGLGGADLAVLVLGGGVLAGDGLSGAVLLHHKDEGNNKSPVRLSREK